MYKTFDKTDWRHVDHWFHTSPYVPRFIHFLVGFFYLLWILTRAMIETLIWKVRKG